MDATPTYIECATGKWSLARELTKSFLLVYRYHSSAMTTTSTLWTKFWTYGTSTCYVWISASAWLTHVYAWHHARDKMLSPSLLQEESGNKANCLTSKALPWASALHTSWHASCQWNHPHLCWASPPDQNLRHGEHRTVIQLKHRD